MVDALFDTNILIDFLGGVAAAEEELGRYQAKSISGVTWIELLAGAKGDIDEKAIRRFISNFEMVPLDEEVTERAFRLRQSNRIKLPDAIIWATAKSIPCCW